MRRSIEHAGAAVCASAAAVLALTGCGTTKAGAASTTTATPTATASPSPPQRHISAGLRRLEDTACGTRPPEPSPSKRRASPTAGQIPEDRPPNYGDNNAYRRALPLKGLAECRGDVHAGRLSQELRDVPVNKARVDAALSRLGYGDAVERLQVVAGNGHFTLGLDGVCVTGTLTPNHRDTIEAHGPYVEGGCVEPGYGH
jgi:hypothetical protein